MEEKGVERNMFSTSFLKIQGITLELLDQYYK